jgi:hypothetical protein
MRTPKLFAALACSLLVAASDPAEYRVTGPYNHDNLSIFLIHGKSSGRSYLTLQEALDQKTVVVYETHNVNELAIENLSDKDVFVQGGDIVKGGDQDRVLGNDFVLQSKSGKLPISAFCVEPGRWAQRGQESSARFSTSTETIGNAQMTAAVKLKKNQAEVWQEVAKAQSALDSATNTSTVGTGSGAGNGGASGSTVNRVDSVRVGGVRSFQSPSSLQLTLESKAVTKGIEGYVKSLSAVIDGNPDAIGFAFAVNGKINSADVYASSDLFRAMWPKLLKSSAVEAVRVAHKGQKVSSPAASDVNSMLRADETAKTTTVNVGRIALVNREAEKQLVFESRDGDSLIHRNYIAK